MHGGVHRAPGQVLHVRELRGGDWCHVQRGVHVRGGEGAARAVCRWVLLPGWGLHLHALHGRPRVLVQGIILGPRGGGVR